MTTTISHITVREKTPELELIWFDGRNAIAVGEFLQGHGHRATVEFHNWGTALSILGSRINPVKEDNGIWVGSNATTYTKAVIDESYEVVKSR